MEFDSTFWVAISFLIFIVALVYLKVPQKVIHILENMIVNIKNEIKESEKLRSESKKMMDASQSKLDDAEKERKGIVEQAKKDSENLIIEMNDKFHSYAEIKKNTTISKISQMKESAIKEIKDTSINLAIESVEKIISTSVDKSKLDSLFEKNLKEAKSALKKINT